MSVTLGNSDGSTTLFTVGGIRYGDASIDLTHTDSNNVETSYRAKATDVKDYSQYAGTESVSFDSTLNKLYIETTLSNQMKYVRTVDAVNVDTDTQTAEFDVPVGGSTVAKSVYSVNYQDGSIAVTTTDEAGATTQASETSTDIAGNNKNEIEYPIYEYSLDSTASLIFVKATEEDDSYKYGVVDATDNGQTLSGQFAGNKIQINKYNGMTRVNDAEVSEVSFDYGAFFESTVAVCGSS